MDPTREVTAEIGTVIAIGGETIGSAFSGIGVVVLVLFVAKTAYDTDFFGLFGTDEKKESGTETTLNFVESFVIQIPEFEKALIPELTNTDGGGKDSTVTYHPEWKVLLDPLPPKIPEVPESFPVSVIPGMVILMSQGKDETKEKRQDKKVPDKKKYPGNDPNISPGEGWVWRGPADKGSWFNPETGETLHPDLSHPYPEGPHWDYIPYKNGPQYRILPDGSVVPK